MKAIAHSYWRAIKRGVRTFESVKAEVKEDVRSLAQTDVKNGVITEDDYANYIGESYSAE